MRRRGWAIGWVAWIPAVALGAATPPSNPPPESELLEFLGSSDAIDPDLAKYLTSRRATPSSPTTPPPNSPTP